MLARMGGLVLAVALGLVPTVTGAQPPSDQEARAHFETGRRHYDQGRFEDAAREFEEAYRLSPRPELLYNISQASREAGNPDRAIETLRQYLAEVTEQPNRAALDRRLRTMEEQRSAAANERDRDRDSADPSDGEQESSSAVGFILMGVAGVAVVAGLITGWLALEAESDLEAMCPDGACPDSVDVGAERSRGQTLATLTDVLVFGGLAIASAGLAVQVAF